MTDSATSTAVEGGSILPLESGQLAGAKIGRYQVLTMVGAGGMGEVYCGHDPSLDRPVAIKRLHPGDKADEKRAWRLRTEAQMHGRLQHPNIVRVYDFVAQDGADHIVSEYVDGQSLRELTDERRPTFRRALEIMLGIARGLSFAHEAGIIHRDLKTENILIGADETVKITDFGISRSVTSNTQRATHKTEAGTLVGTFQSMSPEQSYGAEVDARSDLFSFAIMAYEVFAGRSPFEGKTIYQTLTNIRKMRQTPLRELVPEVPVELSELIDRLLAKEPEARPGSAALVVETLDRLMAEAIDADASTRHQVKRQVALAHLSAHVRGTGLEEQLASFHAMVRSTAQAHRALLVYAAGEEALICFGYPEVHENNTQLAAELVSDLFARVSLAHGQRALDLRAAVDVGEVTVHDGGTGGLILGTPVRRVMNLGRHAAPGEVLASPDAHRPLARFFRLEAREIDAVEVDGETSKGALCYAVVEQHSIENARTSFVGRAHEIDVLRRGWETVRSKGAGRVIALEGEAGIGKSRLVRTFLTDETFHGRELLTRATPNDRYAPFEPFRRLLGRLPEIQQDDGDFDRAEIERQVRPTNPDDAAVVAAVAHICGVAEEPDTVVLRQLEDKHGAGALATKLAWFLLGIAEEHPLVLVFEDLHWADHASRRVIDELAVHAHRLPLYLIVTHRPEYEPSWGADRSVTRLPLERLSENEAAQIVAELFGDSDLRDPLQRQVLDKALGVPLWLEELASSAVDQLESGVATIDASVPATLRDSVQNRLHHAGPETRATAELLAAIGREVVPDLVFAVAGRSREARAADIDALKQRGLIQQRGLLRNPLLVFRHALMRDAIYGGVDEARRRELHAQIVTALHTSFEAWESEKPELFAYHTEEAGRPADAAAHWYRAGAAAAKLWSHDVACGRFKRALALISELSDGEEHAELERKIRVDYRQSLQIVEGLWASEIEQNNARLAEMAGEAPPSVEDLWMGFLQSYLLCNVPALEGSLAALEGAGDDKLTRYVFKTAEGMASVHFGRFKRARACFAEAIGLRPDVLPTILDEFTEHTVTVAPNAYLQWVEMLVGNDDAVVAQQDAMENAFPKDSPIHLNCLAFGTVIFGLQGDAARARPRLERVLTDGEGVLAAGHIHVARYFKAYLDLKDAVRTAELVDQEATAACLAAMWDHFLGWHAGFLRASSIIYCALTADACADVAEHAKVGDTLKKAALAQAQIALDWGLNCVADPGADALHRYFNADLYRAVGRVARIEGDRKASRAAFGEAHVRCDLVMQEGGEEPKFLVNRLVLDAARS